MHIMFRYATNIRTTSSLADGWVRGREHARTYEVSGGSIGFPSSQAWFGE